MSGSLDTAVDSCTIHSIKSTKDQIMYTSIASCLSGSCTPAIDLLDMVQARVVSYYDALRAYNNRLHPKYRVVSLRDAAEREYNYMRSRDL